MRTTIALLVVGVAALASAVPTTTPVDKFGMSYRVADKTFLQKQENILRLFKYILQTNYYKDQAQLAKTWKIEENLEQYTNQQAVKDFLCVYKDGMLPRGQVFSIFYEQQREQAIALFRVLYYAKDWDTFYKTACWARDYINEGMFVYAMHVAVLHRQDLQGIVLPAIYEIFPYYFVNSEVIDKAYEYKMKYGGNYKGDKDQVYYVMSNYTGWYLNVNPEQHDLAYLTEDIGYNAFYYYMHMDYPFWMEGEEFGLNKDHRGEIYYFLHQSLLARYYMERLSNDWGSIPTFDWREPIKTGYVPSMRYQNGLEFPIRPAYMSMVYNTRNQPFTVSGEDAVFRVQQIEDYERRIRDAIDMGWVLTKDNKKINIYEPQGFEILGNLIEANEDSVNCRFYGYLQVIARQVLGYSSYPVDQYKIHPSVLEHFETALRDPIFYQFYKRIIYYFLQYKSHLPQYTYTELNYPGVKVEGLSVDKLITYRDMYEFDITNALYVNQQEFESDDFQVRARQYRLNHKPFTYKINVQSDKDTDVVVRVFLGPKYDEQGREIPMNDNRVNFIQFDKFMYQLKSGKNIIERNSRQTQYTSRDRTTYRTLYKQIMAAINGQEEFHLDMSEAHNRFPARLALPKGKESGQVYQLYVYLSPYKMQQKELVYDNVISAGVGSGQRFIDDLPMGYPLDRQIKNENTFYVANSYIEDVVIFHKSEKDMQTTQN